MSIIVENGIRDLIPDVVIEFLRQVMRGLDYELKTRV